MVDFSEYGVNDDMEFCRWLTREIGLAGVPGSSFFHEPINHLVRFHFAKNDETLLEAGRRLLLLKERQRLKSASDSGGTTAKIPFTPLLLIDRG